MRLIAIAATTTAIIFAGGTHAQEWASFWFSKKDPGIKIVNHDVRVEVNSASRGGHSVWSAKRVQQSRKQPDQTSWTDSDDCPAMMPAFAKLQSIEPISIVPPGVPEGRETSILLHGKTYHIHAHGHWRQSYGPGEIDLSDTDGSAVADWVEETLNAMAPCWQPQRPGT